MIAIPIPKLFQASVEIENDDSVDTLAAKTLKFLKDIGTGIYEKVTDFVKGCINHVGGIVMLGSAVVGLTYLIGELPFLYMLPAFVEGPMFAPVVAALIVWGLCKLMKWQHNHKLV